MSKTPQHLSNTETRFQANERIGSIEGNGREVRKKDNPELEPQTSLLPIPKNEGLTWR